MQCRSEATCQVCKKTINRGADVEWARTGLAHEDCADPFRVFEQNKARIEAGETYRAQAPSAWRLGRSPGSTKAKR